MSNAKPSLPKGNENSVASILARNLPRSFQDVFPIVGMMRDGYTSDTLKSDVIAGLTVAVMVGGSRESSPKPDLSHKYPPVPAMVFLFFNTIIFIKCKLLFLFAFAANEHIFTLNRPHGVPPCSEVVPQGMAYAALASLTPEIGLYSCIVPILTYAVLGTSRQLAVGPVAMVALLTTAGLSPLADPNDDPVRYQQLASSLAFLVGCMQAGMGFLKLEFVARFLPHPVLSGFTSAAAIVIGSSQLKDVFRLKLERSENLHEILESFFAKIGDTHALTVVIALTSIAALVLARHAKRRFKAIQRFPEALFLVAFWIVVSHLADFEGKGVKVIGEVPSGFPSPKDILWSDLGSLVSPALTISLVGFLESFAVAKTIAEKEGYQMSAQRELIGLGLCNVAGAFFKCMPVTGGFSRSAVNYQAGAKTTFSSVVTAVTLIVTVMLLTPLFRDLPKPILAAIIIVAVSTLVDFGEFRHLWKTDKRDFVLVALAFVCTLFWGLLEGILVSAGFAIVMLVQKVASPHSAVLVRIQDDPPVYRNRDRFPDGVEVNGAHIFRMDAPLFFANADAFKDEVKALAESARVIVIHGGAMPHVDSSGVACLESLRKRLALRGKSLVLCEFNGPCRDVLAQAGLTYDGDGAPPPEVEEEERSKHEGLVPMFLSLNDAVTHVADVVKSAGFDDVAVDVVASGVDDDDAGTPGGGGADADSDLSWGKTAVAADE